MGFSWGSDYGCGACKCVCVCVCVGPEVGDRVK